MNRRDEKTLSEQYRQVPRVDSPAHLDQRILQAAKQNAPGRVDKVASRWFPTLATACIAGAVFYIATPFLETPSYRPPAGDAILSDSIVVEERIDAEAADVSAESVVASPAPVAQQQKQKNAEVVLDVSAARNVEREVKKAEKVRERQAISKTGLPARPEQVESDAGAIAPQKIENNFSQNLQQNSIVNRRSGLLSRQEIAQRIQTIRDLADKALIADAQRLLDALVAECPQCEIPTSVAALNESDKKLNKPNKPQASEPGSKSED